MKSFFSGILEQAEKISEEAVAEAVPMVWVPEELLAPERIELEGRREVQYFPAEVFEGPIRVQPLLTPDNYQAEVLELIQAKNVAFSFKINR